MATEGTRLREIAPATFGVMFLGTPHRGSKSASLGRYAYQITRAATKRPNLKLLMALERNSEVLGRVTDVFNQMLLKQEIRLYSFREEQETRKFVFFNTIVVDSDSAKIGHGREEVGSIPANHSNMTKFTGSSDIGFKHVTAQLRRWVDEVRGMTPGHLQACLDSLYQVTMHARVQAIDPSHSATFHWAFDENIVPFTTWLRASGIAEGRIFWIQGKPGSGKSTLMKFALGHPKTRSLLDNLRIDSGNTWTRVGFFFHDRGSFEQKSLLGMLRELLFQILDRHRPLLPCFEPTLKRLAHQQRSRSPVWDLESLKECFFAIAKQQEYPLKLCLFLDALDEHEGDNKELVRIVEDLVATSNPSVSIKICLASRPWPIFKTHFGQCLGIEVHLHTYQDILAYSQSRLESSLGRQEQDSSSKKLRAIAQRVAAKALGVFVWVRIVVDELSKGLQDGTPIHRLEQAVDQMPEELKYLYARTMTRIEPTYLLEGFAMLQIILCSQTPLTLTQLMTIVDTSLLSGLLGGQGEDNDTSFDRGALLRSTSLSNTKGQNRHPQDGSEPSQDCIAMTRRLASRSGGLLEIAPGDPSDPDRAVQFLHQTVKEFTRTYFPDGITGPIGYELLLHQACVDPSELIDPVRPDVLYYAKAFESFTKRSCRQYLLLLRKEIFFNRSDAATKTELKSNSPTTPEPSLISGYKWWLLRRPEVAAFASKDVSSFSVKILDHLLGRHLQYSSSVVDDVFLYLAVGAELLLFIEEHLRESDTIISPVQLAAFAPNFVPGLSNVVQRMKNIMDCTQPRIEYLPSTKLGLATFMGGTYLAIHPDDIDDSYESLTLAVLLDNKVEYGPTDIERMEIAEQILLNHNVANCFTVKQKVSFLEHCMLNESPEMLRVFLKHGASVDYLSDKERVWNLTLFRNHAGIFEVLKDYEINLSHEICADYKKAQWQSTECQETLVRFLIMSSTSICMMPTATTYAKSTSATFAKPVSDSPAIKRAARKEEWYSESYNPFRKSSRPSSWSAGYEDGGGGGGSGERMPKAWTYSRGILGDESSDSRSVMTEPIPQTDVI